MSAVVLSGGKVLGGSSGIFNVGQGGGATLVFSYPSGFAGSSGQINIAWEAHLDGSQIDLTLESDGVHRGGSAWYIPQPNIQSFTTDFTFQLPSNSVGITFVVQNSNSTTNNNYGTLAIGDANADGYGAYSDQPKSSIYNSVGIVFDVGGQGQTISTGSNTPSTASLWINGGPYADSYAIPLNDLNPYGVSLGSGHTMSAHIVYDGSLLTMVLTDTVNGAQSRSIWPVDIPAATTANSAWLGFGGGTVNAATQSVFTWDYYTGYATRLATPTFNVTSGSYTSTQTVTISGPTGSAIYYTTNGLLPTTQSTLYSSPISVSSNTVINAVAVQSGYTDSLIASANYQIATDSPPYPINFPSGFTANDGMVLVGTAELSGLSILLTNSSLSTQSGAAWYAFPANIQTFSSIFTYQLTGGYPNGFVFTIQNQPPASFDTTVQSAISGGPTALGYANPGIGYAGLQSSVGVAFSFDDNSYVGLVTNGAVPNPTTAITGANPANFNPCTFALTYDGTTLSLTITDTVTHQTFSDSWTINIPSTVGGNTAYVGFTAGGNAANQALSTFTFSQG